ncbi:carboxyl-terminal processing protease [Pontibacter indicus]|uniref:Carboxyl-terminal processing protease n=2 Tax=Pontibacter indicus TaxID=1317125 RepID=A0A1R3WGJ4_9BACT|nr:carboxyl-terminal processing protease [Pontibacter indicus]
MSRTIHRTRNRYPFQAAMQKLLFIFCILAGLASPSSAQVQQSIPDKALLAEDLEKLLTDLSERYIYLKDKKTDLACIREKYIPSLDTIRTATGQVLFFEYLLYEFYDSHLILNTNRKASYRLYAPLYANTRQNKTVITQVWQTQISNLHHNIIGAEVLKFNGRPFGQMIDAFPTVCHDKSDEEIRNWIGNKILSGRYDQPRNLELKLTDGRIIELNLDDLQIRKDTTFLTSYHKQNVGVIRLNNSLGNGNLIREFDKALDALMHTKGLLIDLRNTVDGGDSYIARAIMGRFVQQEAPYQKHWTVEAYADLPPVVRTWVEYVAPRGKTYTKPVVILVDRWTGSMGEGLAIGFEGMGRAVTVGTEMERLAGAMQGFSFKNQKFGYRLSTEKLFHINGTPREKYIPTHLFVPKSINQDEILVKGFELVKRSK